VDERYAHGLRVRESKYRAADSMKRRRIGLLLLVAWPALAGCGGLPDRENVISGGEVERRLERALDLPLVRVPQPRYAPSMVNVTATYEGRSASESLLVVVFDSRAATAQIGHEGRARGGLDVLLEGNVAVLYRRGTGRPDRKHAIERALRGGPAS
jgi:hypothetical protein